MQKKFIQKIAISFLLCTLSISAFAANRAQVFTSYFANTVTKDPDRRGFAYELVTALFETAGLEADIEPLPWARAQHMAKTTPQALIFPLSWTPTRDPHYDWQLQLFQNHTHFITYNHPKMSAELARERLIGVQLKSSWDNWLSEQGYENVYRVRGDGEELIRLLRADRIDAWFVDQIIGYGVIRKLNDPNFTYSDPVQTFRTYLGTNKAVPYPHMDKLVAALEELRKNGRYDAIFSKYGIRSNSKR